MNNKCAHHRPHCVFGATLSTNCACQNQTTHGQPDHGRKFVYQNIQGLIVDYENCGWSDRRAYIRRRFEHI